MNETLLASLFPRPFPVVGMVHLGPLPGAPRWGGSMDAVLERAAADAEALAAGGADGLLVENFGDAPFFADRVPPETVAAMTRAVDVVRARAGGRPVGVNVLRNDARAALGMAAATGASFVRVNVHVGSAWSDQGLLTGRAHETLRAREALGADVAILADVFVKHAVPPPGLSLEDAAADARERGLADALVVSGSRTGAPVDAERLRRVRAAVPGSPVWIGSGLDAGSAPGLVEVAHGAIVGSALQAGGAAGAPVEEARVRELVDAVAAARR